MRALADDRRGGVIVEFAILVPIMLVLLLASVELPRAMIASNRATYLADNMAQMISQARLPIDTATMHRYIESAPLIDTAILDYARQTGRSDVWNLAQINVTSVLVTPPTSCSTRTREGCGNQADVVFSVAYNGASRRCGTLGSGTTAYSPTTLPSAVFQIGPLIVVDVVTSYQPLFTMFLDRTVSFHRSAYFRPRYVPRVDYADGTDSHNCPGYTT